MNWIKIKSEHISSEYTNAQLGALVRYQLLIARYEREPTEKEVVKEIGKKDFANLKETMSRLGVDTELIRSKVEEDLELIRNKREVSRATSQRYRLKRESDASRDETDKIREDKRRITKGIRDDSPETADKESLEKWITHWNKYTDPAILKSSGKNATAKKKLLKYCRGNSPDLQRAFASLRKDGYTGSNLNEAIRAYVQEIISRDSTKTDYASHRFSMFEFLKQANGFRKFVNK